MEPIRTLFSTPGAAPSATFLPEDLRARYDGHLSFPPAAQNQPYLIANFVSTLDGVISFDLPGQSGGAEVSGFNKEDHFIMGLLRASADAIMIGPGTLQAVGPQGSWLPESVYPAAKDLYSKYRTEVLQKRRDLLVVVVAGSGRLDLTSTVFHTPGTRVLILTTAQGKERLLENRGQATPSVEVRALSAEEGRISASSILTLLRQEYGVELLLHEAGPTLFGQFLEGGFVNELFLTVAPQVAGRNSKNARPGPVENASFLPETAPWWQILSIKQAGNHLFLRYQIASNQRPSRSRSAKK